MPGKFSLRQIVMATGVMGACIAYGWLASLLLWHIKAVEFENGTMLSIVSSFPLSVYVGLLAARTGGNSRLGGMAAIILVCFVCSSFGANQSRSPSDPIRKFRAQSALRDPFTFTQTFGLLAAAGASPFVVYLKQVREFINHPFSKKQQNSV